MPRTQYRVVAHDGTVLKDGFEFMSSANLWVIKHHLTDDVRVEAYLPGVDEGDG